MSTKKPCKTEATKKEYLQRANSKISKYELETGKTVIHSQSEFCDWIERGKKSIKKSTHRKNRSSLVYYFELSGYPALATKIAAISSEGCITKNDKHNPRKTSSQKKKGISEKEESILFGYLLNRSRSKSAKRLVIFLQAGMIAGPRPCEWPGTSFVTAVNKDDPSIRIRLLRIKNAKNTNDRSHGEYRHLILSDLTTEQMDILKLQVETMRMLEHPNSTTNVEQFYDSCRKLLRRVTKKLFPNAKLHITLYSARHQFSADLKAAGYTKPEIAAAMGHAVDSTAESHYGKKIVGRSRRGLVKPVQTEVNRIKTSKKNTPGLKLR